jgi:Fe-S cluster assembly iron-binding protein IscA
MVRVTERATIALQELLTDNAAPPDTGVRLTPDGSGHLGMLLDTPHPGDQVIQREETPVLIVDGAIAPRLSQMEVDYRSTEDDHQTPGGFVLQPLERDTEA